VGVKASVNPQTICKPERLTTDFLVIGSGVAGLRAAIGLAAHGNVLVVTKDLPSVGATEYAQGGVAVALSDEDEIAFHVEDTLKAGDGLCDENAVRVMVEEGPARIRELIDWGAAFDREGAELAFTREGAHSVRRIVHARGDSTGHEIQRVLLSRAQSFANVARIPFAMAVDLVVEDGVCRGALVLEEEGNHLLLVGARAVILATGGLGQLYLRTTNPPVATGDGVAAAHRAGATLMDMEFVQFHPTALYYTNAPQFLLSEAIRGEGGILRNLAGEAFMRRYDPAAELASRDVVSRAIWTEMQKTQSSKVFLDLTHLDASFVRRRFPQIYATCLRFDLDLTEDWIPVCPAAHYMMGGVRTDIGGASDLPGLFAAGEVACTGVHGANRLASNSLLEGLVFGARVAESAAGRAARAASPAGLSASPSLTSPPLDPVLVEKLRAGLRKGMWNRVGIVREARGLTEEIEELDGWEEIEAGNYLDRRTTELKNMITLGRLITAAALNRRGSIGAHFRSDYPERGEADRQHQLQRKESPEASFVPV
jgi:L-aspartate oxidase